jgi:hypothetical protein
MRGGFTTPLNMSQGVLRMLNLLRQPNARLAITLSLGTCLALVALGGCQRKERVVDVRTPAGDVTVDRNVDNGNVEVNTNSR